MLALSTCWKSSSAPDGERLVESLLEFDIDAVELEYRITDQMFDAMRPVLRASGLPVVSVHNFFPFPSRLRGLTPGGDMFSLCHTDKELRRSAIDWTIKTLECANELEASVVILHGGAVDMDPEIERLRHFFDSRRIASDEGQGFIRRKVDERERRKPGHMDSLLYSLDRLLRAAEKHDVRLALENRYHYHELPGIDDFAVLFQEFRGAPLGYWHDSGHAHSNESLTMTDPGALLERYGHCLLGMHLHDADGIDDHLPPGRGEIDFSPLRSYLREDTLQTLELKPGTTDAQVAEGIRHLRHLGFG